jgi:hypothetical protein
MKLRSTTRDVTAASNPKYFPSTHNTNIRGAVVEQPGTPARAAKLVTPPKMVSGLGGQPIKSRPAPTPVSSLPETVSAADIKAQSFRYGGGRSAGNRSLASNFSRKINEQ